MKLAEADFKEHKVLKELKRSECLIRCVMNSSFTSLNSTAAEAAEISSSKGGQEVRLRLHQLAAAGQQLSASNDRSSFSF